MGFDRHHCRNRDSPHSFTQHYRHAGRKEVHDAPGSTYSDANSHRGTDSYPDAHADIDANTNTNADAAD